MSGSGRLDQVSLLHLRYFLTVMDEGTVRAAADRLGISQPSLSQQLGKLEHRLGVRLFERSSTGMEPTAQGRRLAGIVGPALHAMRTLSSDDASPVHVGVPRGLDADLFQDVRDQLGPHTEFVRIDSARALTAIGSGRINAAAVRGPLPPEAAGIPHVLLARHPMGVLLSQHNPLATASTVRWRELDGQRLLWFNEDRATLFAKALLDHCRRHGWTPELVRLDPGGSQLIDDALRNANDLVALRPVPSHVPAGLVWCSLEEPPIERLYLVGAAGRS